MMHAGKRFSAFVQLMRCAALGLFAAATASSASLAQTTYLPSVRIGIAALIGPLDAKNHYGTNTDSTDGLAPLTGVETPTPPEIVELANALKHDPDLIYQYVANNIRIVWMYGLQKGALGAEIDKSGTAFDQAELLVALLRQSGFAPQYVAGTILLNGAQFQAWTGITNSRAACQLLSSGSIPAVINGTTATNCASGFPLGAAVTSVQMAHIWVKVALSGCASACVFDPAYKNHTWKTGIDLASAMGFTSGQPYAAATNTNTTGTDADTVPWVKTFDTSADSSGLNAKLQGYTSALLNAIQTQHLQGAQMEDIIGGSVIVPTMTATRQSTLPYADPAPPYTPIVWTPSPTDAARYNAIPDQYRTTLEVKGHVQVWTRTDGEPSDAIMFDKTFYIDEIYGRPLTVDTNFTLYHLNGQHEDPDNNVIGLRFDGKKFANVDDFTNYATGSLVGSARDQPAHIELMVSHPYAASADGTPTANGGYMNVAVDKHITLTSALTIVHGWGDVSSDLFTKWSNEHAENDLLPKPLTCFGEACSLMRTGSVGDADREHTAAAWLAQYSRAAQIHAALAHSTVQLHHAIGFVYADNDIIRTCRYGPFQPCDTNIASSFDRADIDSALSLTNRTGGPSAAADRRGALHAIAATAAALEGSVSSQLFDIVDPASTATRFEWANNPPMDAKQNPRNLQAQKFYRFVSTNIDKASGLVQADGYRVHPTPTTTDCPSASGDTPWMQQPIFGGGECVERGDGLVGEATRFIEAGFDVVTPQETFLGPGQRGGSFLRNTALGNYSHQPSKQRGGAFVATRYDAGGVEPLEIAHIQIGERNIFDGTYAVTKGGGGGAQPDMNSTYNPATAADVVKSQFVDRSNALGVDLKDGSLGYTSPAALRVGNGGFP
ncbi:MAG TPA: hypothetical protein VG889_08715, partial [Rhizomicrobium sp.]|nr:hypothetical protein [Rhizomicrobium sp.]